jgi:hypothetical protein
MSRSKKQREGTGKDKELLSDRAIFAIATISVVTLFALWNFSSRMRNKRKKDPEPPLFI